MELVKSLPENVQFDEYEELRTAIQKSNVLIVDDCASSGLTLNETLRALRVMIVI